MTPITALRHQAETRPESTAFVMGDDVWSYARFAAEVDRLARGLVARGLRRGDRVALHLWNGPELAVAYHACFRIGAIAAPLNTRLKSAELDPLLRRLRPALYIGQANLYAKVAGTDPMNLPVNARFLVDGGVTDLRVQPWTRLFTDVIGGSLPAVMDTGAPALLLTTSGTTGEPKLVTHTLATLGKITEESQHWGFESGHIAVCAVPMVHMSGVFCFLSGIRQGMPLILFPQFDAEAVLDAIAPHRCSLMLGLPYMFATLFEAQRARPRRVDPLRLCLAAGDVCPQWLQESFPSRFGTPLRSTWGATETLCSLTYSLQPGPVHRIVAGAQIRLIDDRGAPVPRGDVGELLLRGPNVTIGYWAGPGRIDGLGKDGWYHTGDLMRQDEKGDLWFVSRKKELIIRGGSNIAPAEVERVLVAHPAVRDAGVVGVPDPVLGQRVAGFVQLAKGAESVTAGEILADISGQLADYKLPESLIITDEIPRNTLGKIDRHRLLAMLPATTAQGPALLRIAARGGR
jgi:long-chain acyl-CoA synthetase